MRRFALAALLLAAACGDRGSATYDNPAEPVRVRAGSEFTLVVRANPSTGYQWVLMDSAALGPLQFVSKDYSDARDVSDPRASGVERWVFRAPTAGSGIVTLVYKRPEADPVGALAQFNVFVR